MTLNDLNTNQYAKMVRLITTQLHYITLCHITMWHKLLACCFLKVYKPLKSNIQVQLFIESVPECGIREMMMITWSASWCERPLPAT